MLEMEMYYLNDELLLERIKKQDYINNRSLIKKEKRKRIKMTLIQTLLFVPSLVIINPAYVYLFLASLALFQKYIYDENTEELKRKTRNYNKSINEGMIRYLEETKVRTKQELNFTIKTINMLLEEEALDKTSNNDRINTNTIIIEEKAKTKKK